MTDESKPDEPTPPAIPPDPVDATIAPPPRRPITQDGNFREVMVIFLINVVFNLLTLTLFRFWAKSRIRRYLWSHTRILGETLEYTGTGVELFVGFFIALLILGPVVFLPAYILDIRPETDEETLLALQLALSAVIYFFYSIAVYRARRYRLSRTRWRAVRGTMTGSAIVYSLLNMAFLLLTWMTFGLFRPYANVKLWRYQLRNSWFGDRRFEFDGEGGALLKSLILSLLLLIPTLGMSWAWYKAAELRYVASRTTYENLAFEFTAKGGDLLLLKVPNFLMMLLTLGLAYPYVLLRRVRFMCKHLVLVGNGDLDAVGRNDGPLPRYGEGMADFLGVGGI